LENHNGYNGQQCRIRGRCFYVCRTKQGRKTRTLWVISLYYKMHNATAEVSHTRSSWPSSTAIRCRWKVFFLLWK
jgi:hypothetical protein